MLLCGIDFETTGLEPAVDRVIEVGLVLWDVERRCPILASGFLVQPEVDIPDERWAEAEAVHGISRGLLAEYGTSQEDAFDQVYGAIGAKGVEAVVAHNGTVFDKPFWEAWRGRHGLEPTTGIVPWIDTRLDVPEPMTGNLTCIAAKHGFLNPFPHRAVTDVLTMLRVLDGYDIAKVIERARIPTVVVRAVGLPIARKDEAKNAGFYARYDGGKFQAWEKAIKACDLDEVKNGLGFEVVVA